MPKHKRLGEILVAEGMVTSEQLQEAVAFQKEDGGRLGDVLVKLGYVTEEQILIALSKQLAIPYVTLTSGKLKPDTDQNLEEIIPYEFAVRNLILPLSRSYNSLTAAIFDPLDLILIDNVRKMTNSEINPVLATKTDILKAIEDFYGREKIFKEAIQAAYGDGIEEIKDISSETELSLDKLIAKAEEAPVIKLVDLMVRQAIEEGASDIHIEPQRDKLRLRYRIDGILYEISPPTKALHLPIVSRIKILARMDIAEKRLPQDGSFMVKIHERLIDLRVSSVPTIYGEKVVMRILDKSRVPLDLSKIGFLGQELGMIKKGINYSYGLVFLTGPTGSGKSTTLYAGLNELNGAGKNITTIEDPVEYRLDGVNQVQVKPEIGLTFANVLRSFLRQDPDIILVGEVRDLETAEICIRSALTGHLVLSTLHTNDAVGAVMRLVDMGIPNYLVASSLRLVVAQRLVRKLCPACKEPYEIKKGDIPAGLNLTASVIHKPKGCEACRYIGFKGRTLITEVIHVDEELREAIQRKMSPSEIMQIAKKKGTLSLLESGIKRVEEGTTSLEEILSVVAY
ncbi:MAG: Flp pilus assembly complex ATPase component TadA [Candidatus Omnitrophica bacterium]|nr:Flp pilus assembly complex ATPase component TadA [Candidatus Omnitrophota bacterium]